LHAFVNFSAPRAESIPVRRPDKWSVVLSVLALGGIAAAPARADVTVTVHGVVKTALAVPSVNVPLPGVGPVVRDVQVDVPTDGSTPTITVGRVPVQDPEPSPPVSTPPVPTPAAEPATPAQQATPAAAAAPADLGARHDPAAPARRSTAAPADIGARHVPTRRSRPSAPASKRSVAPRTANATSRTVAAPPAPRRATTRAVETTTTDAPAAEPRRDAGVGRVLNVVVEKLPGWVLAVFLIFAALAAGMAVNAYAHSRRARRLAVQRAELVDDVGQLQAALLAPLPAARAGVSFSVAYRPAAGLAAGGDFYDVFELDADRTALLLGDVSGHGRESVTQAALVRYTLRTFMTAGHGPAQAIARTDPCLDGHMDGHFATVIAAVYDHAAHTLTYAKAGHHPPLVLGLDDHDSDEPASPPIGAGLVARPSDVSLEVPAGATVCFLTDGVIEARRRGIVLGADRVQRMLADVPDDAEALLAAVAIEADEINDDLAVCLLHRPADAESPAPLALSAGGGTRTPKAFATGT
jgi:hypothetical protein